MMNTKIEQIVELATSWMDSIEGVTGVGQGQTSNGSDAVVVYVNSTHAENKLPATLKGVTVLVKKTESFRAQ